MSATLTLAIGPVGPSEAWMFGCWLLTAEDDVPRDSTRDIPEAKLVQMWLATVQSQTHKHKVKSMCAITVYCL